MARTMIPKACPACGISKHFPNVATVETDEQEEYSLYRCSGCGLLFVFPVPSIQRHFHEELTLKARQGEYGKQAMRDYFRRLLKHCEADLPPKARILDFGCGFGHFLDVAAEAGYHVEGVEISPGCRQYSAEQLPHITVHCELAEVPSETDKFDLIVSFEVIYLIPSVRDTLRQLQGLLRPGGRIFVAVSANRGWLIALLSRIKGSPLRVRKGGVVAGALLNDRAYYGFSTRSVVRLLESLGFTELRTIRARPPAPRALGYRMVLFLWGGCVRLLRAVTLRRVDLHTKAHVIGRYPAGRGNKAV